MKVTAFGLSLEAGNGYVSVEQVFQDLKSRNGQADTSTGLERRFYIDDTSDALFVRGLVVTVKDQTKFCRLVREGGTFTIKVENLQGKDKIMEFNFFLVNKENGFGIYQYYHQSCSPGTFQGYLRRVYRRLADDAAELKVQKLIKDGIHSSKREQQIRSAHRGALSAATLVRPESLEEILKQYSQIRGFTYEVAAPQVISQTAKPLRGLVKRRRETLYFTPGVSSQAVASAVNAMKGVLKPNSARISVLDDEDMPHSVRIANMPGTYDEQEYDELAAALDDLVIAKLHEHSLLLALRKICTGSHKHIFMAKRKEVA